METVFFFSPLFFPSVFFLFISILLYIVLFILLLFGSRFIPFSFFAVINNNLTTCQERKKLFWLCQWILSMSQIVFRSVSHAYHHRSVVGYRWRNVQNLYMFIYIYGKKKKNEIYNQTKKSENTCIHTNTNTLMSVKEAAT